MAGTLEPRTVDHVYDLARVIPAKQHHTCDIETGNEQAARLAPSVHWPFENRAQRFLMAAARS